jgi:hypothetical protein
MLFFEPVGSRHGCNVFGVTDRPYGAI